MTPMKKRDLKYAMREAVNLASLAVRMREVVYAMSQLTEEGVESAGMKDAVSDGYYVYDEIAKIRMSYELFLEDATRIRSLIEDLYQKEN